MSDREINVKAAIGRIRSPAATERKDGLADLEHIFKYNKNSSALDNLTDKTWHSIFDALFECATVERSIFLKSKARSTSTTRLETCAKALRTVVTAGIRKIRTKTVKALLDHILQILPTPNGSYCEGLSLEYVKCLTIICEYQPHIEHLRGNWLDVVDFCTDGVALLQDQASEPSSLPNSNGSSSLRTPTMSMARRSRDATPQPIRNQRSSAFRGELDGLVVCLHHLTRATNTPVAERASPILAALIQYLRVTDVRPAHHSAFAAINSVLSKIASSSIDITQAILSELYPLIKDMWQSKSTSLKDELLITLILTRDHVSNILSHANGAKFALDVENLLEALQADYGRRLERDQMQLDDVHLVLKPRSRQPSFLDLPVFQLRQRNPYSESHWSILHLMAYYVQLLDVRKRKYDERTERNGDEETRKRQRRSTLFNDVLRQTSVGPVSSKLCALQTLSFHASLGSSSPSEIRKLLGSVTSMVADQHGPTASWAMTVAASFAFQKTARNSSLSAVWIDVFNLASRKLTTPSTCRAASHILNVLIKLNVVSFLSVAIIAETILSAAELHGPVSFCDSSAQLWITLMKAKAAENPSASASISERAVRWVFAKWIPSNFDIRGYATETASNCRPLDIMSMLDICSERELVAASSPPFVCYGSVAQAWQRVVNSAPLTEYILLNKEDQDFLQQSARIDRSQDTQGLRTARPSLAADMQILDLCYSETERVLAKWSEWLNEKSQNLLPETMVTVASLCIVNDLLLSRQEERNKLRIDTLRKSNEALIKSVTAFLGLSECNQDNVDAVLTLMSDYLPDPHFLQLTYEFQEIDNGIIPFALHLSRALDVRRSARKSIANMDDDDLMELDSGFDSQMSENRSGDAHETATRDILSMGSDLTSFRSCVVAYTQLMAAVFQSKVENIDDSQNVVPSSFITYLISLAPSELCACRPLLRLVLSSQALILTSDADALFDHFATEILEVYEYERHEVMLSIELDLLQGCADQWTDTEFDNLNELATEAYNWFIDTALPKNLCSPNVQLGISDLLFTLLKARGPDFKSDPSHPSVRTGLFGLLATGDILIKYHISERIAQFFGHFTLGEHEAVFDDVHKSLPETVTWREGMALRLLVLSRLGSQWSTLLRRCVYHIYETAGMVEHCGGHATFCISEITNSLGLENSQELFRLFASQLLFTWLGLRSITEIPFTIFNYTSLADLLTDVEDEVYSQVLMRGNDTVLVELAALLESNTGELLKRNFGKAAGYCLAWDTNKNSQEPHSSSETTVRAMVEKNEYTVLCRQHLSSILGTFLYTIDEEPQMLKMLSKRANAVRELKALKTMQDISYSDQTLPADQQPLFRSKFLLDRIDRLARRANIDPSVLWTPAVYTFVLRMLLSRIHPALGSLHACSVIRKIRILVGLSGTTPFSGYPLEMTLHGLRPLLTDKQCAEDTIGIVQYLLGNGIPYLSSQISFVAGVMISTLISLRKFVGSSQESTTQESQHRATMTKAQNFHHWIVDCWMPEFCQQYGTLDATLQTCTALVAAAAKANAKANSLSGTPESDVLLQMLADRRNGTNLLKEPAWDLAFKLLCSDFDISPSYRNDILGHDSQASAFASEVWDSCKQANVSREYMLWAARVLGRAHNASGMSSTVVGGRKDSSQMMADPDSHQGSSKCLILQALSNMLLSSNRSDVGLAEETIRAILLRTKSRDEVAEISELLPASTVLALTLTTTEVAVSLKAPTLSPLGRCIADTMRPVGQWVQNLTMSLCHADNLDPVVGALLRILAGVEKLSESLFAPVLHLVLERDHHKDQSICKTLSEGFRDIFQGTSEETLPHVKAILAALLYLHKQPFPQESTSMDRLKWLEIDYAIAAKAAEKCSMHTTALRFAEQSFSHPTNVKNLRRSSVSIPVLIPDDLLLSIFKSIDEPDSFYGVQQTPNLSSVLDRLEYEADGFKGLLFRGARLDSQMRRHDHPSAADTGGLIRSLINLNLNALPHSLLSNQQAFSGSTNMADSVLYTARKLEQWDIRAPGTSPTETSTIFNVFQGINNSRDQGAVRRRLDNGFYGTMTALLSPINSGQSVKSCLRTLAILAEVDDVMSSTSPRTLRDAWSNMQARSEKLLSAQREDVQLILSSRETLFSTLGNNTTLRDTMQLSLKDVRSIEVQTLLSSCNISRKHSSLQDSLATATYLSDLSPLCKQIGLDIEAAAQNEVADALWDQGEHSTSIRMLKCLKEMPQPKDEGDRSQRSKLLAKLGHHVAEARLEQPDQIMCDYLGPAIKELKGHPKGDVAGQVFHQYAAFCDAQLHNPDLNADFERIQRMRDTRRRELEHWRQLLKATKDRSGKDKMNKEYRRAGSWYKLDDTEYKRLRDARESFMTQSLENYLLALSASDSHDNDVLRFFALWLEFADSDLANTSVGKHLASVQTAKFVRLMNQLSSRLQNEQSSFQDLLSNLVLRIAIDHPFHAMHHISAGSSSVGVKTDSAKSRMNAAKTIAAKLKAATEKSTSATWHNIHATDSMYHNLAVLHDHKSPADTAFTAGRELALDDFRDSRTLATKIKDFKLPPPTMNISVRFDKNYKSVPRVVGFLPKMRIANGLSAPKIVVARCSDGKQFKQLFKGGSDDLRQDAIMEQVFEEVSKLLANHTATRQRNLRIRTYKVLPLTSNSGIMEFVQNTKAFHDVLIPLHTKHFPKDWKTHSIRTKVNNCRDDPSDTRVKIFRDVMDHFNPAMRFFFLEQYSDPDEWFEKRIAYTRSTAAISILGHVVGLGDRHLHNILIDENSGEVVHIDLGVAFEAGRILPIPEVVPFRLTRDLVDGMGYTKTEGVFRRCCEFTLDALREEREGIMTLLNVLRYDPLYSWTVSPLKAKQLQETEDERGDGGGGDGGMDHQSNRGDEDDAGEAGRALTVVEKKLSKTLSTAATVSELISQATDERNLAVLFAGWSAWV